MSVSKSVRYKGRRVEASETSDGVLELSRFDYGLVPDSDTVCLEDKAGIRYKRDITPTWPIARVFRRI